MRITCAIHSLSGGGAERVMAGLAMRLSQQHSVCLITLSDVASDRYACGDAVTRVGLNQLSDSRSLTQAISHNRRRIKALRAAVGQSAPDVVLSFCDKMNIVTLAACKPLAIPVVISERSHPAHQNLGRFWSALRHWYYPSAAAVVAQTISAGTAAQRWTKAPLAIIPAAVEVPASFVPSTLDARSKTVVSIGRLSAEKRIDRLIDAFAKLPHTFNDWTLQIYGNGDQRAALQQQAAGLTISKRVEFCGWCDDVWSVLAGAGAFALTSQYEGFPNALLESLAAGVPSLAIDCESGPREIIRDAHNGLLIPQDDPPALAAGLQRLLADTALRTRLSIQARSVTERFDWKTFADAYAIQLTTVAKLANK